MPSAQTDRAPTASKFQLPIVHFLNVSVKPDTRIYGILASSDVPDGQSPPLQAGLRRWRVRKVDASTIRIAAVFHANLQ
jgi:hypothetical protein